MTEHDRKALELAFETASRDPDRAEQLQTKLKGMPNPRGGWFVSPATWEETAMFAAYDCQMNSLNLPPWECPPCQLGDREPGGNDLRGFGPARKLLDKMLAAGVSQYHPDPMAALAEAER